MAIIDPANLGTDSFPVYVKNINLMRSQVPRPTDNPHVANEHPELSVNEQLTQTQSPSNLMSVIVDFNMKQLISPNSSYGSILSLREGLKDKMSIMLAVYTDQAKAHAVFSNPNVLYAYVNSPSGPVDPRYHNCSNSLFKRSYSQV